MDNTNGNFEMPQRGFSKNIFIVFLRKNGYSNGVGIENAISIFLANFNSQYGTNVTFKHFLDIYKDKIEETNRRNITIICKAFLEFIQNNGIEIGFEGKKYILKYSVIGEIKYILENKDNVPIGEENLSPDELKEISKIDAEIKNFIYKIRDYFLGIIDYDIDKKEKRLTTAKVKLFEREYIDDKILQHKIRKFTNEELVGLLEFVYKKIPIGNRDEKIKNKLIAQYLFGVNYEPYLVTAISRIYEGSEINAKTVEKINSNIIRDFLGYKKPNLKKININGLELDISDENSLIISISELSAEEAQVFYFYLVEKMKSIYNILDKSINHALASILQFSAREHRIVWKKLSLLQKSPTKIDIVFLLKNINIPALINFLTSKKKGPKKEFKEIKREKTKIDPKTARNKEIVEWIYSLENKDLLVFLNHIYKRASFRNNGENKHTIIAKYLLGKKYKPEHSNIFEEILKKERNGLPQYIIKDFDFEKVRESIRILNIEQERAGKK